MEGLLRVIGENARPGRVFFTTRLVVDEKEEVFDICGNYAAATFEEYQSGRKEFIHNVKFYAEKKGYSFIGDICSMLKEFIY